MDRNRVVYSTDNPNTKPDRATRYATGADKAIAAGATNRKPAAAAPPRGGKAAARDAAGAAKFPDDGVVRITRETQHRGGKTVTAIYIPLTLRHSQGET